MKAFDVAQNHSSRLVDDNKFCCNTAFKVRMTFQKGEAGPPDCASVALLGRVASLIALNA